MASTRYLLRLAMCKVSKKKSVARCNSVLPQQMSMCEDSEKNVTRCNVVLAHQKVMKSVPRCQECTGQPIRPRDDLPRVDPNKVVTIPGVDGVPNYALCEQVIENDPDEPANVDRCNVVLASASQKNRRGRQWSVQ